MYEITIKEACTTGFWSCLQPTDWIQMISVIIAMLAAIASFVTVYLTRKQFTEQSEERKKKYRPMFKIKAFYDGEQKGKYFFDIVNEGFPFYIVRELKWRGNGDVSFDHFNGQIVNKSNNVEISRYENFTLMISILSEGELSGFVQITLEDLQGNNVILHTPEIEVNEKEITNGIKITYQYLS